MKSSKIILYVLVVVLLIAAAAGGIYLLQDDDSSNDNSGNNQAEDAPEQSEDVNRFEDQDGIAPETLDPGLDIEEGPGSIQDGREEIKKYSINMKNYAFSPSKIEASPGGSIQIELTNIEGTHNLVIDELNLESKTLDEPGASSLFTVEVPDGIEPGEYEFYCSIGNHRQLGMIGTLVITGE